MATFKTRPSLVYPPRDIIAPRLTLLATVRPALTALSRNEPWTWACFFWPVRIWDLVGEDQALKGEYKVISGKMYVRSLCSLLTLSARDSQMRITTIPFDYEKKPAMTLSGMAKASASSPLAMGKKSACASNTLFSRNCSGFANIVTHLLYG
jgi:hypothetical protein